MLEWKQLVRPGEVYAVDIPRHGERAELSVDPTGSEIGIEVAHGGYGPSVLLVLTPGEARAIALGLLALAAYIEDLGDAPPPVAP